MDSDFCVCVRCHKIVNEKNFYRMNFKGTGEIRKFKICNECNIKILKKKVDTITADYNKAYNYITNEK